MDGGGGADEAGGAVLVGADVLKMNECSCSNFHEAGDMLFQMSNWNIQRNTSGSCVIFHKRVIEIEIFHLWKETRGGRVEKRKTRV